MADSTGLSWYQDPSTLALASLGLGAAGTGLGAVSAMNTAQQQNALRNAAMNTFTGMTTPGAITGQGQQYYNAVLPQVMQTQPQAVTDAATTYFNAGLPQVNTAAENLLRTQIAPIEGMSGYDPRSGQGQYIYSQAVAPLYYQAWADAVRNAQNFAGVPLGAAQTAIGQAQGAQSNALGALGTATPNVNVPAGSTNALSSSLQGLMLMQALQGLGKSVTPTTTIPPVSATAQPGATAATDYTAAQPGDLMSYAAPTDSAAPTSDWTSAIDWFGGGG